MKSNIGKLNINYMEDLLENLITWDNEEDVVCICGSNINDKEDLKQGIKDLEFILNSK